MIHPAGAVGSPTLSADYALQYEIVPCTELPSFDPTPTAKAVLLGPRRVKVFNAIVRRVGRYVVLVHTLGVALAVAMFVYPAPVGRILAPCSALLHLPGMLVFAGGMHTEFAKFLLPTFELWFMLVSNTLWAAVLCVVLQDLRMGLVIVIWGDFNNVFFQESYFHDPLNIALTALWEALFLIFLMAVVTLELVDNGQHHDLISTQRHKLSTKDVLVNVLGTLATLTIRIMYRRLVQFQHQRRSSDTATRLAGYRCRIALRAMNPPLPGCGSITPGPGLVLDRSNVPDPASALSVGDKSVCSTQPSRPQLLQLQFSTDPGPFDTRDTIWPRFGSLRPLKPWQRLAFTVCAGLGRLHSSLILFPIDRQLPCGAKALLVLGFVQTVLVCVFHLCCCQRQLIKRLTTSFDYWFLTIQGIAGGLCFCDVLYWHWTAICAVIASFLWGNVVLLLDAVTPVMRHRLGIKMWMVVLFIVGFMAEQLALLADVLILNNWELQDRVIWDGDVLGHKVQFHVVPFLLSRQITIFIWCTRILYNVVTRKSEGSLILLRGHTEFDYESWRRNAKRRFAIGDAQRIQGE